MATAIQQAFRRYGDLIAGTIPVDIPFAPQVESDTAVQVERGTIFPLSLAGRVEETALGRVERIVRLASGGVPSTLAVVDRAGHHRPAYRPLLVYAWMRAYGLLYETLPRVDFARWDEALRSWADLLEAELTNSRIPDGPIPAARGALATESAWAALALFVAGKILVRDAWTDLASDTFGRLTRWQQPGGALLAASAGDNPETLWYHELVLLHAAASYAVQGEDRTVAEAVARGTEYHQRETQPDHATTQPWGLFAFIWNPRTRPLADQLLHAATVEHPSAVDGVSLILLADALYCLRLFEPKGPT